MFGIFVIQMKEWWNHEYIFYVTTDFYWQQFARKNFSGYLAFKCAIKYTSEGNTYIENGNKFYSLDSLKVIYAIYFYLLEIIDFL